MDRDTFKYVAAGQFSFGKPSVDVSELNTHVSGALFAYDFLNKLNRIKDDTYKRTIQGPDQTNEASGNRNPGKDQTVPIY